MRAISTSTLLAVALTFACNPCVGDETSEQPEQSVISDAPSDAPVVKKLPAQIWVGRNTKAIDRINAALDRRLPSDGFDFPETPLEEVVTFLLVEYQIPILIDTRSLDELGLGSDEPVSISAKGITLRAALEHLLRPLNLTYLIRDEILLITTEDEAYTALEVAIYPINDLLGDQPDYEALIDTIIANIESDTWAENGGGEAEIRPLPQRTALIISQTEHVHRQIVSLLDSLRQCYLDPDAPRTKERSSNTGGGSGCSEESKGGGGGQFAIKARGHKE